MNKVQSIGADIGRGYAKGYTIIDGVEKSCNFKSVVALGREMDFENYEDPIYIDSVIDGKEYNKIFMGILAEEEGYATVRNSKDSKVTDTAKKLLSGVIGDLAETEEINLMLGVPNREFKKSTLNEIKEEFEGKTIVVKNRIDGKMKKIKIVNVSIFRESDAALLYQISKHKLNNNNDNVMVNVGFRTTEISFYDNNLKYNDKKSLSLELGNKTVLEYVQNIHGKRTLEEIDSSSRYDELKKEGYKALAENLEQTVESMLVNLDEINLYIAGGVSKNLEVSDMFIRTEDPQMITAKGLYMIAERKFGGM
ncbi:ParM/StbA family protein (plasmid) [Clostridium baratii]